ncbi:MAG TPA: hypothetical protein VNP93_03205 [Gaiellaceae bacterium]|nr:hypothetical protein [Gaiellaceae bacterium]
MSELVQAAVAGDVTEGEEIKAILVAAGIESELEPEDEADAIKVLVPEGSLEAAKDAIEAMTEPDDPIAD